MRKTEWTSGDIFHQPLHAFAIFGLKPYLIIDAEPGVFPLAHAFDDLLGDLLLAQEQIELRHLDKMAFGCIYPFGDDRMHVRVPVYSVYGKYPLAMRH